MHENDVAAVQIVGAARGQMRQNLGGDFFGGLAAGNVGPIVGVDAVADRDVAFFLREFERTDLIGGVGLFVDGVGRAQERGANADQAGKEALGEIQLEAHVGGGNVADVGMGEGVVADGVAFVVNAFDEAGKFVGLNADEKKCGGGVLAL